MKQTQTVDLDNTSIEFFNSLVSILRIHPVNEPPRPIGSGFFVLYRECIYFILTLHNFQHMGINKEKISSNEKNLFISNPILNLEIEPRHFHHIFFSELTHEETGAPIDENDFVIIKLNNQLPDEIKIKLPLFKLEFNFEKIITEIISSKYLGNYCVGFPLEHPDYDYDLCNDEQKVEQTLGLEIIQGKINRENNNLNLFNLVEIKYSNNDKKIGKENLNSELNGFSGSPVFVIVNKKDYVLLGMLLRANGTSIFINHIIKFINEKINKTLILKEKITHNASLKIIISEK